MLNCWFLCFRGCWHKKWQSFKITDPMFCKISAWYWVLRGWIPIYHDLFIGLKAPVTVVPCFSVINWCLFVYSTKILLHQPKHSHFGHQIRAVRTHMPDALWDTLTYFQHKAPLLLGTLWSKCERWGYIVYHWAKDVIVMHSNFTFLNTKDEWRSRTLTIKI